LKNLAKMAFYDVLGELKGKNLAVFTFYNSNIWFCSVNSSVVIAEKHQNFRVLFGGGKRINCYICNLV
jgi:hypothetical protein